MLNFFYFPLALGWLGGCGSVYFLTKLPTLPVIVSIAIGALIVYLLILLNLRRLKKLNALPIGYLSILGSAFLLGFSYTAYEAYQRLSWTLPSHYIRQPITITGKVQGLPLQRAHITRFELVMQDKAKPILQLVWPYSPYNLKPGDKLTLTVTLTPLHTLANPGSFDIEKDAFLKGIRAKGVVKAVQYYEPSPSFSFSKFRYALFNKIQTQLKEYPFKGIMTALIVGEKVDIPPYQFQVLQKTGTNHLIAISGLHVSLTAGTLFFLSAWLWKRGYKAYERLHWLCAQKVGAMGAIGMASLYAALAGWSIPTQRAFIMVGVAMMGILLQRKFSPWFLYCMAVIGVLVITPLAPFNAGFWLSFIAVGSLLFAFSGWTYLKKSRLHTWLAPQWAVFIGLLPLSFLFFQQTTLVGPLANMVAIPVTSLVVVPLNLMGALLLSLIPSSPWIGGLFLKGAHGVWSALWIYLSQLAHFPLSVLHKGYFTFSSIILAILGCFLLLLPKGLPGRYIGFIAWLPLLLAKAPTPVSEKEVWFSLLEVGQGLSAIIQTQHHVLLYDTGPGTPSYSDAGQKVIIPFLKSQGIEHIDKIVISHSDQDHKGGLKSILEHYKPDGVVSSYPNKVPEIFSTRCEKGQRWQWDGVEFEMLAPRPLEAYETSSKAFLKNNNQSCVLKVTTGKNSILLPGDIEAIVEQDLLKDSSSDLKCTFLVVPHHGSKSSSTTDFVNACAPKYALFSVGYYNAFGFPKSEVVNRYHHIGAKTYSTVVEGMIQFRFSDQSDAFTPLYGRKDRSKFWHKAA